MTEQEIILYSFKRCPFAMRARMALHEKGIPFSVIEEDLKDFSPALKGLHPEAKVPVLVHGDRVVYESAIITEYIDETFPGPALMPTEAGERAEVRLWTYWCNQIFKVSVDQLKYGTARFNEAECEGISDRIGSHLQKIESRLNVGRFLVTNQLTLADIHVFPFYRQLSRITPTPDVLGKFPKTHQWGAMMAAQPSFVKAMS